MAQFPWFTRNPRLTQMDRRYRKRMDAYWTREERKSRGDFERLDFSTWFDLWHTHPDWDSKGNRYPENRARVIEITCRLLHHAEQLAAKRVDPIQVFATICVDSGNNAVYLHSENPNGSPFPYSFEDVQWAIETPSELRDLVDPATHEVGRMRNIDGDEYLIRSRNDP